MQRRVFNIILNLAVIMNLVGLRPTIALKQSLSTTPRDKKKRGISLSSQKLNNKQEKNENFRQFVTQKKVNEEKKVRVQKFIIYHIDRNQWQTSRRQASRPKLRKNSQHIIEPKTMKIQSQINTIKSFTNSVEFPKTEQFVLQNITNMQMPQQVKPKNRGRVRQIRSRISEIQQRLNSLLQATKIY